MTVSASASSSQAVFGVIGLGVMGRNLALNVEDRGFPVAVWNLETPWTDDFIREHQGRRLIGTRTLEAFTAAIERPRRILMMIKAGAAVEEMISKLKPHLARGDILVDGGNSWFKDTQRLEAELWVDGLLYVGMGVSGGEAGARYGPSLMPGGAPGAYKELRPILEAIAAKTDAGPCVTYVGPGGAGHFVKMVHNGIEYADMQLIAEAYDILHRGAGITPEALSRVFATWNSGPLESFLIEITAKILSRRDRETGQALVDLVLDKAGQKGTGRWTAEVALALGVPAPTIAAAIDARVISSMKEERREAAEKLGGKREIAFRGNKERLIEDVQRALYASRICAYAQGMSLIRAGSEEYGWQVGLAEVARIWKGGCIIRAALLDPIRRALGRRKAPSNLLLDRKLGSEVRRARPAWQRVLTAAQKRGIPVPALSASIAYFDAYRSEHLPQNLVQAQRDAFGAHTYERADQPERGPVHTDWLEDEPER